MSEKVFNNPVLDRLAQSSYGLVRGLYPKDMPVVSPFAESEELSPLILASYPGLMGSLPRYVEGMPPDAQAGFYLNVHQFLRSQPKEMANFIELLLGRIGQSGSRIDEPIWIHLWWESRGSTRALYDLLEADFIKAILPRVTREQDRDSRFLTALLLSRMPHKRIPELLREELGVQQGNSSVRIEPWHNWSNCVSSEEGLEKSMASREAFLVNDCLLTKVHGYKNALSVNTTSTRYGTFFKGSWYTPFDNSSKDRVNEVADKGGIRTLNLNRGVWALMRDSSKYLGESLRKRLIRDSEDYVNTVIKAPR